MHYFQSKALHILASLTVIFIGFAFSAHWRSPAFGKLLAGGHHWVTAHTLLSAHNWYEEGPSQLGFLSVFIPKGPEHTTLSEREIYPSYPPGFIVFPYWAAKIRNQSPTLDILMGINLTNQLLIAMMLSICIFQLISLFNGNAAFRFAGSTLGGLLFVFLPGPYYWMQNVYFADEAVLLPFVCLLLAEVLRQTLPSTKRFIDALIPLIFFWGMATDYLFFFALPVYLLIQVLLSDGTLLKRIIREKYVILASLLLVILYMFQLWYYDQFAAMIYKFHLRTGTEPDKNITLLKVWNTVFLKHVQDQLGEVLFIVLLFALFCGTASFFVLLLRPCQSKRQLILMRFLSLLTLPAILNVLVFREHQTLHNFSALKFSLILAAGVFPSLLLLNSLLPAFFRAKTLTVLLGYLSIATISFAGYQSFHNISLFPATAETFHDRYSIFFTSKITPLDVVFSETIEAKAIPPLFLSVTRKQIHRINTIEDIRKTIQHVTSSASVVFLIDDTAPASSSELAQFWSKFPRLVDESHKLSYYRVPPETFRTEGISN
ncbi:hypothetical protein WDW86_15105 [Bdellovibrionota bacterium FG-2]